MILWCLRYVTSTFKGRNWGKKRCSGWFFVWFQNAMSALLLYASKPCAFKWQQPQQRHWKLHPLSPMPGQSKFIKLNSCQSLYKFSLVCIHFMKCLAQKLFFLLESLRKQFQNIVYSPDLEDCYLSYDFLKNRWVIYICEETWATE